MSGNGPDYDLGNAREFYFAAGGAESQIGPRPESSWYWRRAAKLWRDRHEILEHQAGKARAEALDRRIGSLEAALVLARMEPHDVARLAERVSVLEERVRLLRQVAP